MYIYIYEDAHEVKGVYICLYLPRYLMSVEPLQSPMLYGTQLQYLMRKTPREILPRYERKGLVLRGFQYLKLVGRLLCKYLLSSPHS